MTRILALLFCLCLTASLGFAAAAGGYLRMAHAMAAGQMQVEICGQSGAEQVTVDRFGQPVAPAGEAVCTHCADCALVPLAVLPEASFAPMPDAAAVATIVRAARIALPVRPVWRPSRGPPSPSESKLFA